MHYLKPHNSFLIQVATFEDIPNLAHLHVKTWNATYAEVRQKPTYEIREWQWNRAFEEKNKTWFCFVIETESGELVGFAKGKLEKDGSGNLNKLYLLDEYKNEGLGRLLVSHVAHRFLELGIYAMSVVADVQNPTCAFYEKLGATRIPSKDNSIAVYVWRDLKCLIVDFG
jgi:GNAT superfamily N-acetyltransferase